MKKLILSFFAVAFSLSQILGQESSFKKGDKVINLGLGLGSSLYTGSYYTTTIPPVSASLEYGVVDGVIDKGSIGVGGYLGYLSYKWKYSSSYYWTYSDLIIGGRGVFHYPLVDKLDTYTGIMIGFNISSSKEHGTPAYPYNSSSSGIVGSWFLGGRYYFSDNFAVMAELGYGITYLNIGVAFKI